MPFFNHSEIHFAGNLMCSTTTLWAVKPSSSCDLKYWQNKWLRFARTLRANFRCLSKVCGIPFLNGVSRVWFYNNLEETEAIFLSTQDKHWIPVSYLVYFLNSVFVLVQVGYLWQCDILFVFSTWWSRPRILWLFSTLLFTHYFLWMTDEYDIWVRVM